MFSGVFVGGGLNCSTDPEEERDPPAAPAPISFPDCKTNQSDTWNDAATLPDFRNLFAKILRPTDIAEQHLNALNVQIDEEDAIDDFLPLAPDGTSYFPPLAPEQAITAASYSDAIRVDANGARLRNDFDQRLSELRFANDAAFHALARSGPVAQRVKLAYLRKFWEGLETMSQYWDSSLDQYYDVKVTASDGEQSAKRQRFDDDQSKRNGTHPAVPMSKQSSEDAGDHGTGIDPTEREARTDETHGTGGDLSNTDAGKSRSNSASPAPRTRLRYKGRRNHSGREMPEQFRVETIRAFVEGAAWPFHCSVVPPRQMPTVHFGNLRLPVRQSAAVYRVPKERMRARQGFVEGPMIAVQARVETNFTETDGSISDTKSRLDLMRELGGLLQIAQERRREGKTEVKPGEGEWWTTKARWGGGPGGEIANEAVNSDIVATGGEKVVNGVKEQKVEREKDGSRVRKKKTPAQMWKEIKCGRSHWDAKTEYTAIGKDPSSPYDEIFMVSSLNHHISILKLTVHEAYIDAITTGRPPAALPSEGDWCQPELRRTQWFDLFNVDTRIQAFRALWGVMAYLNQDTGAPVSEKASDASMSGTA